MKMKRWISLCLLLCMVVGLLPAAAFPVSAASGNTDVLSSLGINTEPVDTGDIDANPYCQQGVGTAFNMVPQMELILRDNVSYNEYNLQPHNRGSLYDADEGYRGDIWNNEVCSWLTGDGDCFESSQSVGADLEGTGRKEYRCTVGYANNQIWLVLYDKDHFIVGDKINLCNGLKNGYDAGYNVLAPIEIVAGDFDGDGKDTLWVAAYPKDSDKSSYIQQLWEYRYANGGLERTERTITAGYYARKNFRTHSGTDRLPQVQMTAGDLTGDGTDELIVTSSFAIGRGKPESSIDNTSLTTIWDCSSRNCERLDKLDHRWEFSIVNPEDTTHFYQNLYGSTAVGDVDGDGQNELVMAGWKGLYSEDKGPVTLLADCAAVAILKYDKSKDEFYYGAGGMAQLVPIHPSIRQGTWDHNFQQPLALACFSPTGRSGKDLIFLAGMVYEFTKDDPQAEYKGPGVAKGHEEATHYGYKLRMQCEQIWSSSDERYFEKHNSKADNIWIGTVAVGNFMNDPNGGEQLVFEHGMKRREHEEYRHDLVIIETDSTGALTSHCHMVNDDRSSFYNKNLDMVAVDIDDDALILRFKEKEAYFSDPHVVAVLQAAPYFEDLAHFDQFYVEDGGTDFGKEEGSGTSDTNGFSIQASAIAGFEQEVSFFGIKLFGIEYETEFHAAMGAEFQRDTEVSYSTEFSTTSETDRVIVEMTPYIRYVYDSYIPGFQLPTAQEYMNNHLSYNQRYRDKIDKALKAGYHYGDYVPPRTDDFVVCLPQETRLALINVDTYDKVAEANGFQKIRGNVLDNTPGDPTSYLHSPNGLRDFDGGKNLASQSGPQGGFMHVPQGGGTVKQSITESHAQSNAISWGAGYSASMVAEAGGVKLGYGVGADYEGSHAWTNYNATTCAGTVRGLPEDESGEIDVAANYNFQWQFGKWKADLNGEECMVCGFLVKDIMAPPGLPRNLTVRDTTQNSITLNWQNTSQPDHYKLYLCTDDPDNPYYVLDDFIRGNITEYTVKDLAPGTTYSFVMRSFSNNESTGSTYTLPVSGRTQFGKGTKAPTVEPLADVHAVAGADVILTANATPVDNGILRYQWQELVSENGVTSWKPINRETGRTLSLYNVKNSLNGSVYRCAITQFVGGQVITVYTNGATVYVGQGDTSTELMIDPDHATVQGSYPVAREVTSTETKTVSATVDGVAYTLAKDETEGYLLTKENPEKEGPAICIPKESGVTKLDAGIADGKEVIELLGEDVEELTSVDEYLLVGSSRTSTGIAEGVAFDDSTGTIKASVPKADSSAGDADEESSGSEPVGPEMEEKDLTYKGKYSMPDGKGDLYRVETSTEGTEPTTEISYAYYFVPDRTADPLPAAQQATPGLVKYKTEGADKDYYFKNKSAVTIRKETTETVYDMKNVDGTSITLTATVKSLSKGKKITPTGNVQFVIRNNATGATMTQYAKLGNASGQTASAAYVWNPTAAGTYTITARYVGSNELLPSVSQQKQTHAYEITSDEKQEETLSLILDCQDFTPVGGTIDLNPNLHTVTVKNDGSKVTDTSAENSPLTAEQVTYVVKTEFGGATEGICTLDGNNLKITAPGNYIVTATHTYKVGEGESTVEKKLSVSKTIRVLAPETEVQQQIYFTYSSLTKFATDNNIENLLINPNSGSTVTFTSENQQVATVDPGTGAITPLGEGTTKITATSVIEGIPTVTASYTLNIRRQPVTITAPEIRIPYGTTAEEALRLAGEAAPEISDGISLGEITGEALPYQTNYDAGDAVGRYTLTLGKIESNKYDVQPENGHIVVEPRELTASDFTVTALDKVYDGSAEAKLKVTVNAGSKVEGDSVTAAITGSFDSPDVGEDKTVTYEISSLGGTNLENYRLAGGKITGTATATIRKAPVTLNIPARTSFIYDGQPKNVPVNAYTGGKVFTDFTVTYEKEREFFDEAVSAGAYQIIVTINPASAGNYVIEGYNGDAQLIIIKGAQEAFSIEGIPEKVCYGDVITLSAPDAKGEVSYEVVSGSAELSGDQLTFTGTGNVTVRATAVLENYKDKTVTRQISVNRRELNLSAAATDRPYNASVNVDVTVRCSNIAPGDESKVAVTGTGTMLGNGAGSSKIVYVDHLELTGEKAQYYVLSTQNLQTTVNISPLDITGFTIRAFDKTYDGTADADTEITAIAGVLPEDEGLVRILGTAAFEDPNAEENKEVTFTASSLAGSSAGNYRLTTRVSTATATIRKAPVTVTLSAKTSFVYDGQPKGVSVNAYAGSQLFTDFTVTYEKAGESFEKAVSAGTYQVIVTINPASAGNYVIDGYSGDAQLIIADGAQEAFSIEGIPEKVCYGDVINLSAPDAEGEVSYKVVSGDAELSGSQLTFTGTGNVTVRATAVRENYKDKTVTRQISVNRRELDLSATAADRPYNASVNVDVTVHCGNVIPGDESKVAVTATGTMLGNGAGSSKIVYVNHLELIGEKAQYYVLNTNNLQTTVNISPLDITAFTIRADDKTYDGTADVNTEITAITGVLPEDERLVQILGTAAFKDPNAAENKEVTFTASGLAGSSAGNYRLTTRVSTTTATIRKASVTVTVSAKTSFIYDGQPKAVPVSAYVGNQVFTDFSVTYEKAGESFEKAISAGTYQVIVTINPASAGNYVIEGYSGDAQLFIAKGIQEAFSIEGIPEKVCYGDVINLSAPDAKGKISYEVVSGSAELSGSQLTFTGTGNVTVQATAVRENYEDKTITRQINVNRRELHLSAAAADRPYNTGVNVDVTVRCGNVVPGDESKVAVTGTGTMLSADAGSSKIVYVNHLELTGEKAEYYVLSTQNLQTTVNISPLDITAFTIRAFDKTYDGTADAGAEVTAITGVLPEDEGLVQILGTAAFEDPNAAENKKVTFTASGLAGISAGNYRLKTWASTAEADILPMQVTFLVGSTGFCYDGSAKEVEISAFDGNGRVFEEYTAEYYKAEEAELPEAEPLTELPSEAGEYIIRLVLEDAVNYAANLEEIPMTILQTSQDQLAIVGLPGTVSYKDSFILEAVGGNGNGAISWTSSSPEVTVVPDEQNSTKATVTVLGAVGESINITAVKAADGNYTEKTAKAVFIPEPRTVSFTIENLKQTFDGTEKPVTVIPGEDGVTYTVTYNGLAEAPKDAGMYTVQILANGNYRGGTTAMLIIDPASLEDKGLTVTMNGWTYGDEAAEPQCSEAPEGTTLTVTYSTKDGKKPVNAGKYTVYAAYSGANYNTFTVSAEFEISKRLLTVTANDAERPYGCDNPVLTVSYEGFAEGEGPENLQKEPIATTAAAADSPVNEEGYPIEASGGVADNYTFTYVPGTLTVTGAEGETFYITGPGNNAAVGDIFTLRACYGNLMPQVRWESSDETVAVINEDGKVIALKKGDVTFTATIIDPNYAEGITAHYEVRVDSVSTMLIPGNLVLTYNGRTQGISLTSADEDFVPVLSGPGKNVEITYELNTDPTVTVPRNVGVYTVIYRITDPSYTGSGSAQLTINKASVELRADDLEKVYGEENPVYTCSGLLGEDAENPEYLYRIAAMLNFACDADSTGKLAPAGAYPISLTVKKGVTLEDHNYNLSIAEKQGSLTVLPRELLVHVKNVSRLYGEENPQPECRFDGFVNDENEEVLTGELTFTYDESITKETPAGVYPDAVKASGLKGSNYEIRYVYEGKEAEGAALTIGKLPVTVNSGVAGEGYLIVNFDKSVPGLTTENFTVTADGREVEIDGVKTDVDFTSYILRGSFRCGKPYEIKITLSDSYDLTGSPVAIVPVCSHCPGDQDCPCRRYTDLDPTQWYHEGLDFVLNNNLMNGTGEKIFQPGALMSRAMIVTILWRLEGCPIIENDVLFDDVPENIWYTEAVRWAAEKKVVLGIGENRFAPEDNVTREQLAAILWRYTGEPEAAAIPDDFTDSDTISEYAVKAMAWAIEKGILKGRGANTIVPLGFTTRAEAATMIMRYVNVLAEIDQK